MKERPENSVLFIVPATNQMEAILHMSMGIRHYLNEKNIKCSLEWFRYASEKISQTSLATDEEIEFMNISPMPPLDKDQFLWSITLDKPITKETHESLIN